MSLLEIKRLNAGYEDGQVLYEINLLMHHGEVLCVVGESGSGKTTLLRSIIGHEGLQYKRGSMHFEEKDLSKQKNLLGNEIGLIPQNPAGSFNPIRPFEKQFVELCKSHGIRPDKKMFQKAFASVGLMDYERILRAKPYEMSGGMNQRIAIAAAMVLSPKLLICDEPTGALDVVTAKKVTETLLQIRDTSDCGILMVTHNLGIAKQMADSIVIMKKGRIVEQGAKDLIIQSPKHDYTKLLLESAPRMINE
ncbi:MAG: ABC transporter ATP-binding protein [Lachnospiraceae bacterium]|nr:ABC transporter ATP-binding protein [Lachnospiraceae bacterium]